MITAAKKLQGRFFYGWMIVFMSGLVLFFSAPGQTYSISIFIDIYVEELGFSRSQLSTGYSIATIVSGSLLIIVGRLTDKLGPRFMIVFAGIMLAFATFMNSFLMNIWMVYVGFFLLRYFGQGAMSLIPNALVPQWFDKKRAFAISLSGFGNLLATLSVPLFNIWLIQTIGWQWAWRFWGISLLLFLVPMAFFFVVNRPEDIGVTLDNDNGATISAEETLAKMERESWSLKEVLSNRMFWIVGVMSLIVPMFTTGVTFHWLEMMRLRSVDRYEAGLVIGLIALPFAVMPFLARAVIDRYQLKYVFMMTQIMIFISMALLLVFVSNLPSAIIFIMFYGLAVSIQGVALNTLWPNFYGRKYLGSVKGASTVFMVIGSALGPLPFGIVYDATGSFNPVLVGMMIFSGFAIVLSFFVKKPEKVIQI